MKRLILTTLASCALLGAMTGEASARPLVGVQGIAAAPGPNLDAAKSAGANVTRVEADWSRLQPDGPGALDPGYLAELDQTVGAAASRGIKVVLFVVTTPCWASSAPAEVRGDCTGAARSSGEVTRYRPADPTTAVPVEVALAQRYASSLAAFQIWNEPDQANQNYWAGTDKVATYVQLVKVSYAPLKAAAPNVPVIAGSFVGGNGAWLKAMYAAGVKGSYDGLAVQFYASTLEALQTTRAIQLANGDRTPLWLTEWGFNSCLRRQQAGAPTDQPCVSRAAQARGITDVLATIRKRSWIKAAVLFELRDVNGGYQLGLFDAAGKAKPAFAAFRKYARGSKARAKRPTIRLSVSGDHLVVSGTATTTEPLTVTISRRGTKSVKVPGIRANVGNRWKLSLPSGFGTSNLSVRAKGAWTGSSKVARR